MSVNANGKRNYEKTALNAGSWWPFSSIAICLAPSLLELLVARQACISLLLHLVHDETKLTLAKTCTFEERLLET